MPYQLIEEPRVECRTRQPLDWSQWTEAQMRRELCDLADQYTELWMRANNVSYRMLQLERELARRAKEEVTQ